MRNMKKMLFKVKIVLAIHEKPRVSSRACLNKEGNWILSSILL